MASIKIEYIVAAKGDWNRKNFEKYSKKLPGRWLFCSNPSELDSLLKDINPRYIFFPHWSWIVSEAILDNNECVCFHMTDLPFGRGGSPLQNLLVKGFQDTVLTALKMETGIDTGPVYYKNPLSLKGSAKDIYKRASGLSWRMIANFVSDNPDSIPQEGEVVNFKRRTPNQSLIPDGLSLNEIHDYIRMLDAPEYPKAFIKGNGYHLEFRDSELVDNELSAKVTFKKIDK
jgi:methionyl-tRNA formyltransferase